MRCLLAAVPTRAFTPRSSSDVLVLRRKPNQAVTIGDDVRVVVLAVNGDAVRLGIEAPAALPVRRAEDRKPDSD